MTMNHAHAHRRGPGASGAPAAAGQAVAPNTAVDEILVELSRHFELGYSQMFLQTQLVAHAAPASLSALVDVGSALGLTLSAGRHPPDALDAIETGDLPAVLHFAAGGFGLLVAVDERGFHFRERHAVQILRREELEAMWDGIIVLVEPGEQPGIREPWRLPRRLQEHLLVHWKARLELAGPRSSPLLAGGLLAGSIGAGGLAVAAQPAGLALRIAILLGLALIGVAASFEMAGVSAGTTSRFARVLCGSGKRDCKGVLTSPYAKIGGVHLSDIGFAFLGSLALLLAATALATPAQAAAVVWLVGGLLGLASPGAIALIAAQLTLKKLCTLCMAVHAVILTGAALVVVSAATGVLPAPPLVPVAAAALLWLLLFALLLSSAAPHLRQAPALESAESRLEALLESPQVTLVETVANPPVALDGAGLGVTVGKPDAPIEVVIFAHPMCPACGEVLGQLAMLLQAHPASVRGTIVIAPLKKMVENDRPLCEILVGLGRRNPGAFLPLLMESKRHVNRLVAEDPATVLAEILGAPRELLTALAASARPIVDAAEAAIDSHGGAVPQVFVNGHPTQAPLRHVQAWCNDPSLLARLHG
jgi:uncharacterized membrane protein